MNGYCGADDGVRDPIEFRIRLNLFRNALFFLNHRPAP
jgi:hypothetical protein